MSDLSEYIKSLYTIARRGFEWKPLYFNNNSSMDENGFSCHKEGIKYYILHLLKIDDLTEPLIVPKPCNTGNIQTDSQNSAALTVNNFGRFRYAFDDVETAKKVAVKEVEQLITPFLHCLTNEDYSDVKEFIKNTITV